MKVTATEEVNKKEVFNWENPKTGKKTEFIIYHHLRLISVYSQDQLNYYYLNKRNNFLNSLLTKSKKDISNYTIHF